MNKQEEKDRDYFLIKENTDDGETILPVSEYSTMNFQQAVALSNKLTQSPALESITKLSQQMAESINRLTASPAFETSILSIQQAVVLSNKLTQSPALESITKLSQQMAESINRLTTSPVFEYSTIGILKSADIISELSTMSSFKPILTGTLNLAGISEKIYQSDIFPNILESIEEEITDKEVERILQEDDFFSSNITLDRKIDNITEKLNIIYENQSKDEGNTITKKDFILLLLGVIFSTLINPWIQPSVDSYNNWVNQNRTQIVNVIKNDIKLTQEKENYKNFRVVKKNDLKIKRSKRRDSQTLNVLEIGELVNITYKKKNWSKIKINKNDRKIEGWVYTRYLEKID